MLKLYLKSSLKTTQTIKLQLKKIVKLWSQKAILKKLVIRLISGVGLGNYRLDYKSAI